MHFVAYRQLSVRRFECERVRTCVDTHHRFPRHHPAETDGPIAGCQQLMRTIQRDIHSLCWGSIAIPAGRTPDNQSVGHRRQHASMAHFLRLPYNQQRAPCHESHSTRQRAGQRHRKPRDSARISSSCCIRSNRSIHNLTILSLRARHRHQPFHKSHDVPYLLQPRSDLDSTMTG